MPEVASSLKNLGFLFLPQYICAAAYIFRYFYGPWLQMTIWFPF